MIDFQTKSQEIKKYFFAYSQKKSRKWYNLVYE